MVSLAVTETVLARTIAKLAGRNALAARCGSVQTARTLMKEGIVLRVRKNIPITEKEMMKMKMKKNNSRSKSMNLSDHIVEIPKDGIPVYDSYVYARLSRHVVNNVRIMRWVRGDDRHELRT